MDDVTDTAVEARFFIDHGMIHDRKTGKHVTTDDDSVFCDGRVACCALLNELATLASRQPKPEDLERVASIMHAAAVKSGQMISSNQSDFMAHAVITEYGSPPPMVSKWLANGTDKLRTELDIANASIAELEAEVTDLKTAEHSLSSAYVRLRCKIPGAFDTPHAPTGEVVWATAEAALDRLVAAAQSPTIRLREGLTEAQIEKIVEEVFTKSSRRNGWMRTWSDSSIESNNYWRSMVQDTICALRASATPKPEPVDWVKIAVECLAHPAAYDKDAIMAGLCEQVADLKAKVV